MSFPDRTGLARRLAPGAFVLAMACGYHFEGSGNALPEDIETVAIPIFRNDSDLERVESDFTAALIDEFSRGRKIRVVDEPTEADALVVGRILDFAERAASIASDDQALEVQMTAYLSVRLVRRRDGRVLWSDRRLKVREDFAITADAVSTGSASFVGRSSTNIELDTIEIAEAEQREAVDRAARRFARTVYRRMLEDF